MKRPTSIPVKRNRLFRSPFTIIFSMFIVTALVAAYMLYRGLGNTASRSTRVWSWLHDPQSNPNWGVKAGERCEDAPFLIPTDGYIGFLWGDSFRVGHTHQGIDIFGGNPVNITPVLAAHSGYLTRFQDWKSTVIIRIPDDPLHAGRQIWTYYTHMASPQGESYIAPNFPPGMSKFFVEAGTLLGYQGNYSGTPGNPTGVHLHFSIVLDDGQGGFRNELVFENTLDPTPYFKLPLNGRKNLGEIPVCRETTTLK